MKKALIIGAAGFVGGYLIDHILSKGIWSVSVTKMPNETVNKDGIAVYDLDLLDAGAVKKLLSDLRPDYIFHLAAQSSVALSWKRPDLTVDVNIKGTLHLLDALKELKNESAAGVNTGNEEAAGQKPYNPRVLLIGSGEEYGHVKPEEVPITEETLTRPGNIYAATKASQNMLGKIYAKAFGLDIMSTRSFNHTGPTQAPIFVVADFCRQVAMIERQAEQAAAGNAVSADNGVSTPDYCIYTGNLSARRDFTDVRDVVRAYCCLMEGGVSGETYNVGTGHALEIQEILNLILSMAKVKIRSEVDPKKLRPVDVPVIEPDISRLQAATGWKPEIPFRQTVEETLNYWRRKEDL